jgi:hypothetical protein
MALSDIPEYVKASPGDLVRADQWNSVQHLARNSLRTHRHTRSPGVPPNDPGSSDDASQLTTAEIADGTITAAKLAAGAVSGSALPDGSVTGAKLSDATITSAKIGVGAVATSNLANNAVTTAKLSFQTVNSGSVSLGPGGTVEMPVQNGASSTKTTVYFPTLAIAGSSGSGISDILANIVYRQAVGASSIDVFIRLSNSGAATAGIIWQVLTFTTG